MKSFVWRRAAAIARKEIFHILRDPTTLGAALGLPLFMVMMFGFAIEFNVKNVALAVNDADKTQSSRRLLWFFRNPCSFHPSAAGELPCSKMPCVHYITMPGPQPLPSVNINSIRCRMPN